MPRDNLVQRLIAFLKRPDALEYDRQTPVRNRYDDYETQEYHPEPEPTTRVAPINYAAEPPPSYMTASQAREDNSMVSGNRRSPHHASRLDALVMRAVQQFNAQQGYVIRYETDGRMRYCTGRDFQGRYIPYTEADPDRRAVFLALDSGESQLFVHTQHDNTPIPVLCGPLHSNSAVIGVLYLDNPARSRLHRGVFDVFCDQAARMLVEGVA